MLEEGVRCPMCNTPLIQHGETWRCPKHRAIRFDWITGFRFKRALRLTMIVFMALLAIFPPTLFALVLALVLFLDYSRYRHAVDIGNETHQRLLGMEVASWELLS